MEAKRILLDDALDAQSRAETREPINFLRERELRTGIHPRRQDDFYSLHGKRIVDIGLGVPLSIVATPVIFALAGLVIAMDGRPAFYQARRLGRDGREFHMWKLRTMVPNADSLLDKVLADDDDLACEYVANFKLKHDPRITRFGRFLRRHSLDELPQLWNVLRGEMSLVGPRPYYAWELESQPQVYEDITSVSPGLTGPWQVSGRNDILPAERMQMDRDYVRDYTFVGDMGFLARTILPLLKRNGH